MKITSRILSIPPYLSTPWKNIVSLHVRPEEAGLCLIVTLQTQNQIEVPGLSQETIDTIFAAHAKYVERGDMDSKNPLEGPFSFSLPLKADGQVIDSLGSSMQHNPEQSDLPPLPPEVLNKIAMIAHAFGLEDTSALPHPEPNCHCVYCQVAGAIKKEKQPEEEVVADADLHFRNWDITQTADHLYRVVNPLDTNEYYDVFLSEPLGCTCGKKNCEHICAVLNS